MIRFRRRNTLWLTLLGLLVGLALLTETTMALPLQAFFIATYLGTVAASSIELGAGRNTLADGLRLMAVRNQITPDGKEANERAKQRGGFANPRLNVLDVGLIAAQMGVGEMNMRRARSISKDDDGVRPFITLHVQKPEAGRNVILRFEVEDHNGDKIFVHEMRTFLREGEMNIVCDHQLRLNGNEAIQGAGDWELRVYVENNLMAVQTNTLSPSIRERNRRLAGDLAAEEAPRSTRRPVRDFDIIDEVPQERPARLQDLLQQPPPPTRRSVGTSGRRRSERGGSDEE